MSRPAQDIVKVIKRKKDELEKTAFNSLRDKAVELVNGMIKNGSLSDEVNLTESDLDVLDKLVNELKELDYRYCLIEEQNEEGDVLGYRLRISVSHLDK